jgi:hypothetical protein
MEEGVEDVGEGGVAVAGEVLGAGEPVGGVEGEHASDEGLRAVSRSAVSFKE